MSDPTLLERHRRERFDSLLTQLACRYKDLFAEEVRPSLLIFLHDELEVRKGIALKESLSHLDTEDLIYLHKLVLKEEHIPFEKPVVKPEVVEAAIVTPSKEVVIKRRGRPKHA